MTVAHIDQPPPPISVHPMDVVTERAYVSSTTTDALVWDFGGKYADRREIRHLTEGLIDACSVSIASFPGEPEDILGYVAKGADETVELFYIRLSLADVKTIQWQTRAMRDPKVSLGEKAHLEGQIAKQMRVAVAVAQALLPEVAVTFRRLPPWLAMEAVARSGHQPIVRPRAL